MYKGTTNGRGFEGNVDEGIRSVFLIKLGEKVRWVKILNISNQ